MKNTRLLFKTPKKSWARWLPNGQRIGDEKIIFLLRRHWITLVFKYAFMAILALIPAAVFFVLNIVNINIFANNFIAAITIMTATIYYIFIWIHLFTIFIDYYLDLWIVTTHRIIDIEQKGLFNHIVSEQSLEQVQDVSSSVNGVIPTVFEYGLVLIQTAGHTNLFHFKQVPHPAHIARRINQLSSEYRKKIS